MASRLVSITKRAVAVQDCVFDYSPATELLFAGVFDGDVRCVAKRQPASELAVAILEVFEGHIFLSPRRTTALLPKYEVSGAPVASDSGQARPKAYICLVSYLLRCPNLVRIV
jgi:hypothetical protein